MQVEIAGMHDSEFIISSWDKYYNEKYGFEFKYPDKINEYGSHRNVGADSSLQRVLILNIIFGERFFKYFDVLS